MPSISDKTEIGLPLKNLLGLIAITATAVWAYFGIISRLTQVETALILTEKDLEKNTEFRIKWPRGEMGQLPADNEQYMLLEFLSGQTETIQKEMESMMSNTVNINFLKDQVLKLQQDVEKLKDKVRNNGTSH
tara:strand:+ start:784 stop:1182 length:399 start_codon:yes stop_codon:yes gene_type:complete